MYLGIYLLFVFVILTGHTRILVHRIGQIFKKSREEYIDPLNDDFDAMHAHDKEEAEK